MLWDNGDNTGILTVKKNYNAIATTEWPISITGWRFDFWKWKLPLKLKIFTWITLKRKIPTWDLLQKIGWTGPNICQLCFRGEETSDHLFIHFQFTHLVWNKITHDNDIKTDWNGNSTFDCLEHWTTSDKYYKTLPLMVNWFIWLSRNCKIFENKIPNFSAVAFKALGMFQRWKDLYPDIEKKKLLVKPPFITDLQTGWFDSASQHNENLSDAGG
jgi:hypothetical protein